MLPLLLAACSASFDGYCPEDGVLVVEHAPDVPLVTQCGEDRCLTLLPVEQGSLYGGWYFDEDGALVVNCAVGWRITVE